MNSHLSHSFRTQNPLYTNFHQIHTGENTVQGRKQSGTFSEKAFFSSGGARWRRFSDTTASKRAGTNNPDFYLYGVFQTNWASEQSESSSSPVRA